VQGGASRVGWIAFMHHKGFLDDDNGIVWTENPASKLSAWAYEHLIALASTYDPSSSASASASTSGTVGVGDSAVGGHRSGNGRDISSG
jgi:hypothetical protein